MFSGKTNAERRDYVVSGKAVAGLVARLAAIALKHALVPFTTRLRPKNASACVWFTSKYRQDGVIHSIQDVTSLGNWLMANREGADNTPMFCIYAGQGNFPRGMALLSRICDAGGPIRNERSHLLDQFENGSVLMAIEAPLPHDLPAVQAEDLWIAIREALHILVAYNFASNGDFNGHIKKLMQNLPLLNTTLYREQNVMDYQWRSFLRVYGAPDLPDQNRAAVKAAVDDHLGIGLEHVFGSDADGIGNVMSGIFREAALAVPTDGTGVHAHCFAVSREATLLLLYGAAPAIGPLSQQVALLQRWQLPAAPPVYGPGINVPGWAVTVGELHEICPAVSGAAGYILHAIVPDPVGGAALPAGMYPCNAQNQVLLDAFQVAAAGQSWYNISGMGFVPMDAITIRVTIFRPINPANYLAGYVGLDSRLRRFDVPAGMHLRPVNDFPQNWEASGQCTRAFMAAHVGDPVLAHWDPGVLRNMWGAQMRPIDRAMAMSHVLGHVLMAHHRNAWENEDFGSWVQENRAHIVVTNPPAKYNTWLGGCRVVHDLHSGGGLWTLAFTPNCQQVTDSYLGGQATEVLQNSNMLCNYILRLRVRIEIGDTVMRTSNTRFLNATGDHLIPTADLADL